MPQTVTARTKRQLRLVVGYPCFVAGLLSGFLQLVVATLRATDLSVLGVGASGTLLIIGVIALFPEWPPAKIITRHIDALLDRHVGDDGFDAEGNPEGDA